MSVSGQWTKGLSKNRNARNIMEKKAISVVFKLYDWWWDGGT